LGLVALVQLPVKNQSELKLDYLGDARDFLFEDFEARSLISPLVARGHLLAKLRLELVSGLVLVLFGDLNQRFAI